MTTTKILRHINAIRSMRLLHDGRSLSRAEIARELGLTRATIGNVITVLDNAGYIVEGELAAPEGRKGRPGVAVTLNASGAYFVGLDIGTRVLTAVVVDLRMDVVSRIVEPTGPHFREPDAILEKIIALVRQVISKAAVHADQIEGLCVSVPGVVARDGSVINAPFLEWRNYALRDKLIAQSDQSWNIVVCNDAFAFANAEASSLSPINGGSVLLVLMAEGLGAAIIDAGKPMLGAHGYSGEIGHMLITVNSRTDTFEMLAGAKSFANLLDPAKTVSEGVAELLSSKEDPGVAEAMELWAEALATGFANTIHLLDPGRIVLGGPLSALFPVVAAKVEAKLRIKLLPGLEPPVFAVAKYGTDGAAIGAAATIREALFTLPELS